ncbi:MAG: prepilin peptidase [Candidatus Komeilibacteria bacterium]|nr:prepilin peptidase [Candidatus Komeilibacteria bacterium]
MWSLIFFFIFGLIIGSFLNAVIYRLHSGESVARGRSKCFNCQQTLSWKDLVPLLSFVWLRGHCRYCQNHISWQYPLVELASGLLFAAAFYIFFSSAVVSLIIIWQFILSLILISFCLIIFVYDFRYYLIVEAVVWAGLIIMTAANLFIFQISWVSLAAAGAGASLFFWLQLVISRGRWLGSGDVLLGLFMGLTLGWPKVIVALVLAYWVGAAMGLILLAMNKKQLGSRIPFGPFLMIGLLVTWFWGDYLITLLYG